MDKVKQIFSAIISYVYPPTRKKLHRLLHGTLVALATAGSVCVWIKGQNWGWNWWNQLEAQSIIIGALIARWSYVVERIDAVVDELPIPEDSGGKSIADNKTPPTTP